MTDYAAAWLSEMWPTVHQYNPGDPTLKRKPVLRKPCPICGAELTSAYLSNHILRRHPETVEKPVSDAERGVA